MSKAAKLIMGILFVLLGISVFVVLNVLNQKENFEKTNKTLEEQAQKAESRELKTVEEKKALGQEKTNLESQLKQAQDANAGVQKKLDEANERAAAIEGKVSSLNSQINTLAGERDDWKKRVEGIKKERDNAMTKLEEVSSQLAAKESEAPEANPTSSASAAQPSITPPPDADDHYWAGVLKQKASLEVKLTELQDRLSKDALEISDIKKKSSDLELELTGLKSEKMDVERKLKFSEDLASNLSLELARLKNDRKMGNDQLGQLEQDNDDLRTQVKSLSSSKVVLEKSIAHLSENKNAVENKLDETKNLIQGKIDEIVKLKESIDQNDQSFKTESKQAQLKPMIDDLMQMKGKIDQKYQGSGSKEVELQPIIVSAESPVVQQNIQSAGGSYSGFQGHLMTINEPNNFVVLDIGESAGLNVGDQLRVFHGPKSVARLKIIQVRKEIAAADIIEKTSLIQVGDIVR